MPPKKPKEGDNFWRTRIETGILDDDKWKVKVSVIEAAGSDLDRSYMTRFEEFALEEKRCVIKNICKTETMFMINQLGGEKKVKETKHRVFEEAMVFVREKMDIPTEYIALVIKHLILDMKEEYLTIKREKLQVKLGIDKEMVNLEAKDEYQGLPPAPLPVPPDTEKEKKGKKKGEAAPLLEPVEGKKYSTQLRERGEEWRDKLYVDDYPVDGPNIYVAVTGFLDKDLAVELLKIGVPLVTVIQIRIDPLSVTIPPAMQRSTKRNLSQSGDLTEKAFKFWNDILDERITEPTASLLKHCAFIVYSPPYAGDANLSADPETIYDEISFLLYDVHDMTRQHILYLQNMDVISVPSDSSVDPSLLDLYGNSVDYYPLECLTLYSVMDAMLRSVVRLEKGPINNDDGLTDTKFTDASSKTEKATNFVRDVFKTLTEGEDAKKAYRLTYGEEFDKHQDPVVIQYGDIVKYTTFQLDINLNKVVRTCLLGMPYNRLWDGMDRPSDKLEAKINFHVNVLLSCFDRKDIETSDLNRMIHLLACRKLHNNRSSLHKEHTLPSTVKDLKKTYLKRTALAEPITKCPALFLSNSPMSSLPSLPSEAMSEHTFSEISEGASVRFLYSCPDISDLVTINEITENQPLPHMIDDYNYFEDFSGITALQVLLDAFNSFNCLDYKYCEVSDCIIAMFFNSSDCEGIWRERWRGVIPNPVCLQDFFDYVLEEHYDWFQYEERKYDEKNDLRRRSESLNVDDETPSKCCLNEMDVAAELLMEGSLKHDELLRIEEESELTEVTSSKMSSKKVDLKSAAFATPTLSGVMAPKVFTGYDIGDRRVEVFGNIVQYFSEDSTSITTNYFMMVPNNDEYVSLHLNMNKGQEQLWVHRLLGERGKLSDVSESFRVNCKDDLNINILKRTRHITVKPPQENVIPFGPKVSIVNPAPKEEYSYLEPYHAVNITWPNGLFIEAVYEENSTKISHIKQTYLSDRQKVNEETRCISWNGEILSFKKNGEIEIFCPDSTIIKLIDYKKQEIKKDTDVDLVPSVLSSLKGKSKDSKSTKSNKKSSSEAAEEAQKLEEPKELELKIDEFEIIHPNGLMQKQLPGNLIIDVRNFLIRTATDYNLGEVFSRRNDGTNTILNKDGVLITMFPDGSRIITRAIIEEDYIYPEWTEEEQKYFMKLQDSLNEVHSFHSYGSKSHHTNESSALFSTNDSTKSIDDEGYVSIRTLLVVEHPNFATVTLDRESEKIDIDSPNGSTVTLYNKKIIEMQLSDKNKMNFDGETLCCHVETCDHCVQFMKANVSISKDAIRMEDEVSHHDYWMTMTDTKENKVVVDDEGGMLVLRGNGDLAGVGSRHSGSPPENAAPPFDRSHSKECYEKVESQCRKFFVLRRSTRHLASYLFGHSNMTCSELVHRMNVENFRERCLWQPWCSIQQHDTFGDHRSLLSVLCPLPITESEKWLVDSKLAGKPKYLKYKDLQPSSKKGFYHWMRPYGRFKPTPWTPENVLPQRQPKAFLLRTLEQQWHDTAQLRGAKELVRAVLQYRLTLETQMKVVLEDPLRDIRQENTVKMDQAIQALGEKIYKELKARLSEDIATRKQPSITTGPAPTMEEEGEASSVASSTPRRVDAAASPREPLRRYWLRRDAERKEQQFYQYLLRSGEVPGYFSNILGGAIWWEVNDRVTVSVTEAELKKLKCICDA